MAKRAKPKGRAEEPAGPPAPAAVSAAPVPGPVPGPSAEAIASFERAVESMQRHLYEEAADRFRMLIERFPAERGLLDRGRVYLDHCERESRRQPPAPRTVEERLTAATAALNLGDEGRAESLAASVLAEEPRQDLALYLLAAIAARREATDAALMYLAEAIAITPEVRAQARLDLDFQSLRDDGRFRQLVEPAGPAATGSNRRSRRARAER